MRRLFCICAFCSFLMLSGCASIVNGTSQSVSVNTPPVNDATCMLTNSKGTWYVNKTPGSVTIHRAYDKLSVSCHKIGCVPAHKIIKSNTKAITFGNVLFGGAIGAGIDVADGAAYSYPEHIVLPMKKLHKSMR